ncbi:MAG: hypothetical protein JXL67_05290 [Calditrichaeota bacterium]|nr:hypothetical protein [Calditrichota bacterium]
MKIFQTGLFCLLFISLLYANAVIVEWKAEPEQNKIVLQWKTSSEEDVNKFIVERSNDNSHYVNIGEVQARGPGYQYKFEDTNLGMTNSVFYYRLQILNGDGSFQHTDALTVIPNISNISRSWGSIKALFR